MEEIINSIMHNPENTNPNVLRDQLQEISSGAGVVIVDSSSETLENKIIVKLNIKAEELYNLSKNNIVFNRQVYSDPESGNFEEFNILRSYSYGLIQPTGSEMGYRFEFQNGGSIDTFMGTADDYPYYEIYLSPINPDA